MRMIAIIDYGMGNIHSVAKALGLWCAEVRVTNKAGDIADSDKVVLPGVGAFADAMKELKKQGLSEAVLRHISKKKPFLGICLGMQLLFERSQESQDARGLGVLAGSVEKIPFKEGIKVPHIGWNEVVLKNPACPLFKGMPVKPYVYFCHSYYARPEDQGIVSAVTGYGFDFASSIWKENIYGVQFHPEKSQQAGLKIIENFVKL